MINVKDSVNLLFVSTSLIKFIPKSLCYAMAGNLASHFLSFHALNFHSQFDKSSNSFVTLGCFGYGPMQDKKKR